MSRDILRSAMALCKAGDAQLAVTAAHDPGMIRDVAASCLWAWSATDKDKRQAYLSARLPEGICRADLVSMFGISTPQASVDIRAWGTANPGRLSYDTKRRRYFSTPEPTP